MPPAVAVVLSNSQTVEEANRQRFDDIRALADDFAKRDMKAKDALYVALESLFSFVLDFETEADRKAFVVDNGGKWGKVATENPFQPFVKLAFCGEGISDASRSQYATVLNHARYYRDKSMSLAEWLRQPGGLEARYREAASGALSKDQYIDTAKLSDAKRNVVANRRSGAFHLDDLPIEIADTKGGFVVALLQVGPDGAAHVVEYTERDQVKIDSIIAGMAKAQARAETVKAQPLHGLHRALQILAALVPEGKNETDTVFVLFKSANDAEEPTVLRAMSTIYTGVRGEVEIADRCKWLPAGTLAVFTHATAKAFHRGFDVEGAWSAFVENGQVRFEHDNHTVPPVPVPICLPGGAYYEARTDFSQTAPMYADLPLSMMVSISVQPRSAQMRWALLT